MKTRSTFFFAFHEQARAFDSLTPRFEVRLDFAATLAQPSHAAFAPRQTVFCTPRPHGAKCPMKAAKTFSTVKCPTFAAIQARASDVLVGQSDLGCDALQFAVIKAVSNFALKAHPETLENLLPMSSCCVGPDP